MSDIQKNISDKQSGESRRRFLRKLGMGALGFSGAGALLGACKRMDEKKEPAAEGAVPTGMMTMRRNRSTGDNVSLLGYGCMRWPTKTGNDGKDVIDQEMVNRLVDKAIEHGVNYFDTSPAYCQGRSEAATGIALSRHPRESYYIATKLSNFAPQTWGFKESVDMYRNSLKELKTDYIDYMLLHGIGMGGMDAFRARYIDNGLLDFLLKEREQGRIRNLGFSYHGDVEVFDHLLANHEKYRWDFVQIQLNYLDWEHAKETNPRNTDAIYLYGKLDSLGIQAVIMEPLLGGRLAKVPEHIVSRLKGRDPLRSVASWAFRFAGSHPGVLTVLSGMTCMEHLEDNLRTYCPLVPLTDDDNRFLYDTADLMMQHPAIPCNDCKYCMPCPWGIDIPGVLLHYNKMLNEDNIPQSRQDPKYSKARRAFLVGYNRAVEPVRQADHCIGCRICVQHCPQGIDIPAELARVDNYAEKLRRGSLPG